MAVERDKTTTTTTTTTSTTTTNAPSLNPFEALSPSTSRESKNLVTAPVKDAAVNDLLNQLNKYNLENITPSILTSTYGKSNEAILAALLKEQGLGPTTPRTLEKKLRPLVRRN